MRSTASCAAGRWPGPTRAPGPLAIAAYLGSGPPSTHAIGEFAQAYADQNERDYRVLVDAIAAGRLAAIADV